MCIGSQHKLFCAYRLSNKPERYDFALKELDMTFELAPTLIIESHYRKSFCREKYLESVREVPTSPPRLRTWSSVAL
ncbi:hypothetical protein EON65_53880 [archaeon]|nr:MAG: hypothetical protein EON65_53880 [archaeon]